MQIRSARANGAVSVWESIDAYTVSLTLSVSSFQADLAPQSLVGVAVAGGADIIVQPFTVTIGTYVVSALPAGSYNITGLTQLTLYYVYYLDTLFAGGAITPISRRPTRLISPGRLVISSSVR
jgi:hypothetical protein